MKKPSQGRSHAKVGAARSTAEIIADPEATAEEIRTLDRRAAVMHPNCPVDLWWIWAENYPLEAIESLAGQLFLLEEPDRWADLQRERAGGWIEQIMNQMPKKEKNLLAADCAEHVLPIYEGVYPGDQRPREAIRVRRLWIRGKATLQQWMAAQAEANAAAMKARAHSAEECVAHAAAGADATLAVATAAAAAGCAARMGQYDQARDQEQEWQWARLLAYAKKL